jgi:transcriptional regulator with XRE-family HTH domain
MNLPIGDNIKRLRTEQQVTQEQLADHLNITYQAVSKWENDVTTPDVSLLPTIADFFDVKIDELFRRGMAAYENKEERLLAVYEDTRLAEDFTRADTAYQKLLASNGYTHHDLMSYGVLHGMRSRDYLKSAIELHEKALECGDKLRDVRYYQAQRQLVGLLWRDDRNKESIEKYEKLLEAEPDNVQTRLCLVIAYEHVSLEKAWEILEEGLHRSPDDAQLLYAAGEMCKALKRYSDTVDFWDKALVSDSELGGQIAANKALLYRELGEYEKAFNIWEALIEWLDAHGFDVEQKWPKRQIEEIRNIIREGI